jgi:hypothetical protein
MFDLSGNLALVVGATLCGALLLAALAKAYELKWLETLLRVVIVAWWKC